MGDVGQIGAASIGAATDLGIAAMTNEANRAMTAQTNKTSLQIAHDNNVAQAEMSRENNAFSHDEAQLAYDRSVEQWRREMQYNSPIEQVKRLQEAGLNPNVMLGSQGLTQAVSAPSYPAASPHGSGITPSMPNLVPAQFQFPAVGREVAEIFKTLVEARKAGIEAKDVEKTFKSRLALLDSDAQGKRISNAIQEAYGDKLAKGQFDKTMSEVAMNAQHVQNLLKEGKLTEAQEAYTRAQESSEQWRSKQERVRAETVYSVIKQELDESRSRAEENRAAAQNQRAQAETENALRGVRKLVLEADNENTRNEARQKLQEILRNELTPRQFMEYRDLIMRQFEADVESREFDNTLSGRIFKVLVGASSGSLGALLLKLPK